MAGKVSQVIGAVVDCSFEDGNLPKIYDALEVKIGDETLTLETQQHLGQLCGGAAPAGDKHKHLNPPLHSLAPAQFGAGDAASGCTPGSH